MGAGCEESLYCQGMIYWLISSLLGALIEFPESCKAEFVALLWDTDERMFWKQLTFSSALIPHLRGLFSAAALSVSKSDNIKLYTLINQLNCSFPIFSPRKVHINNCSQKSVALKWKNCSSWLLSPNTWLMTCSDCPCQHVNCKPTKCMAIPTAFLHVISYLYWAHVAVTGISLI